MKLKDVIKYLVEFQWEYVAYALPALLIFIIFYFRNRKRIFNSFMGFVNWIRPSLETGGLASPEKITAVVVTTFGYLPGNIIFMLSGADPLHKLGALVVSALFVSVLYKIITPQQLEELRSGIKTSIPNTPDVQQKPL